MASPQADGHPGVPSIEDRVCALIALEMGLPLMRVTRAASFDHDLAMDSVDRLSLTLAVEDDFHLDELPDDVASSMRTVGDLVTYLERHETEGAAQLPQH